ncbi:MAG: hypothetical protein Q8K98_03195 [Bacteroidota bacterium]|nr:hypothetical protein [Bacteroidota bacterium]
MKYFLVPIFLFTAISCREIIPFDDSDSITGYQINGLVTNSSGTPVADVNVYLSYEYVKISNSPIDTITLMVVKDSSMVSIDALSEKKTVIRNLFTGWRRTGPIPRYFWSGEVANNVFVSPGYYFIRYSIDSEIKKDVSIIIERTKTASTDSVGKFIIPNINLPVNKIIDRYDTSDRYLGTYAVTEWVFLELYHGSTYRRGRVELKKDVITRLSITM